MKALRYAAISLLAVIILCDASYAEEKIRIGGSGGMIPLVTELAKAYMANNKGVVIEVHPKSVQSAGGIMGAADGRLDIGMANRDLKDKEKALGLEVAEIARVAVVIGVNKGVRAREITSENLCKVYEGKIAGWKELGGGDGKIFAITKSESDSTKEVVRKNVACFRELKEAGTVVLVPTTPEITKILSNRTDSIGFTDSVAVADSSGSIIAMKFDGVGPTADNIKSGKYKLSQRFTLVTKGQPKGAVKDFIDFVKGPKGAKIIEANKAVAVR